MAISPLSALLSTVLPSSSVSIILPTLSQTIQSLLSFTLRLTNSSQPTISQDLDTKVLTLGVPLKYHTQIREIVEYCVRWEERRKEEDVFWKRIKSYSDIMEPLEGERKQEAMKDGTLKQPNLNDKLRPAQILKLTKPIGTSEIDMEDDPDVDIIALIDCEKPLPEMPAEVQYRKEEEIQEPSLSGANTISLSSSNDTLKRKYEETEPQKQSSVFERGCDIFRKIPISTSPNITYNQPPYVWIYMASLEATGVKRKIEIMDKATLFASPLPKVSVGYLKYQQEITYLENGNLKRRRFYTKPSDETLFEYLASIIASGIMVTERRSIQGGERLLSITCNAYPHKKHKYDVSSLYSIQDNKLVRCTAMSAGKFLESVLYSTTDMKPMRFIITDNDGQLARQSFELRCQKLNLFSLLSPTFKDILPDLSDPGLISQAMATPEYQLILDGLNQNIKRIQGEDIPGVVRRFGEVVEDHIKISIEKHGEPPLRVTVYYAAAFAKLRSLAGIENFDVSLAAIHNWSPEGGKSSATFSLTADGRYVLKVLPTRSPEIQSVLDMLPSYFEYHTRSLLNSLPSVMARLFGYFEISVGGSEYHVMCMENVYLSGETRRFDLKGIRGRSRLAANADLHSNSNFIRKQIQLGKGILDFARDPFSIARSSGSSQTKSTISTLWDADWLSSDTPTFHAGVLIAFRQALTRDVEYLTSRKITDYSLLVSVDDNAHQITCGIVDYACPFSLMKKLESGLKTGISKLPDEVTIKPPEEYGMRFLEMRSEWFKEIPSRWSDGTKF